VQVRDKKGSKARVTDCTVGKAKEWQAVVKKAGPEKRGVAGYAAIRYLLTPSQILDIELLKERDLSSLASEYMSKITPVEAGIRINSDV
jgi:hypothetical protein